MSDLSVNPSTYVIYVPKDYMTLLQTTPYEIRELDSNQFRNDVDVWMASSDGIYMPQVFDHHTEVTIDNVTYARTIRVLDPYTITFEDGQYQVNITGSNNNIHSRRNLNQVSLVPGNSAGLIKTAGTDPWSTDLSLGYPAGSAGAVLNENLDAKVSDAVKNAKIAVALSA